ADDGAVLAAAEAVIELLFRAHPERRRLFAVERAAGLVLAPLLLEWHARADDLGDVGASDQLIDEGLGDSAHYYRAAWLRPGVSAEQCRRSQSLARGRTSRP